MTSMVERVARRIATEDWRRYIDEFKSPEEWAQAVDAYDLTNNSGRFVFDQTARAAIEAMREPTEAMIDHADAVTRSDADNLQCPDFYRAMIDAALAESKEG